MADDDDDDTEDDDDDDDAEDDDNDDDDDDAEDDDNDDDDDDAEDDDDDDDDKDGDEDGAAHSFCSTSFPISFAAAVARACASRVTASSYASVNALGDVADGDEACAMGYENEEDEDEDKNEEEDERGCGTAESAAEGDEAADDARCFETVRASAG